MMIDVFDTVVQCCKEILEANGNSSIKVLKESKIVDDLGLRSLDIAQLIAMLEIELDKEPFSEGKADLADIITVGDLCKAYQ